MILLEDTVRTIYGMTPNFGFQGFSEIVYYDKYSRVVNGKQETWADTVLRVISGIFTVRRTHMMEHRLPWDEVKMQRYAREMAISLFKMEWTPPGRGLWAMGTDLIYQRGSMFLNNCALTKIGQKSWINDLAWLMDALMCGAGVGFIPERDDSLYLYPITTCEEEYTIPDSREGWVDSVTHLLSCIELGVPIPRFNYDYIRSKGTPLRTFGGTASGPDPLRELHERIVMACALYVEGHIDSVRLKTDLANFIGCCVVAGNIRRSAEIALAPISDDTFIDLKNYTKNPDRASYGWMSNNSVTLSKRGDYDLLGEVAARVMANGEPGIINLKNFKQGRIGDRNARVDYSIGTNPCGEITLEDKELCNLAITCPTRCVDLNRWYKACEYATFYASTVALIPTHWACTNEVIARNRRIGIDILDFASWKQQIGTHTIIRALRHGYKVVTRTNQRLAREAGVPESIRKTTMKPNGTVSKVVGRPSTYPNARYMLRRIRISRGTPMEQLLINAGIPNELCVNQPEYTRIFEYPIYNGEVREIAEVSLWEQAMNLVLLQREWSDNAVSNTLYFKKEEERDIEHVLSSIVPVTKSVSMCPFVDAQYKQMPEERISKAEYTQRLEQISTIDWSNYNRDSSVELYCEGGACSI